MINTVQQALEDVYVALGGQEDIDRLTVSQVLAKIYNVLGGTGDHGDETVPQLIDLIATVATGGGGGGGDSDWTTAEVTFANTDPDSPYAVGTCCVMEFDGVEYFMTYQYVSDITTGTTVTIPLYKGMAHLSFGTLAEVDSEVMPTVSGNVTIDTDNYMFDITGDCTITCKGAGGIH